VYDDEVEEHGENEGGGVAVGDAFAGRGRGRPCRAEDAGFDGGGDFGGVGFCVGEEELGVELREDVPDAVGFVGELHAEEGFEEGEEGGGDGGLEGGHVGEGEEEPDRLDMLVCCREKRVSVYTYLVVRIDFAPAVFLHLAWVYGDVVAPYFEILADGFPPLLCALDHATQCPI